MASAASSNTSTSSRRPQGPTVQVEFGGQKVDVPKGGYYDRYRMNPNLDEVARDPAVGPDISFFRQIPKELVDSRVGQVYAPNFYYRTKSVQLVFLAPLDNLKSKLPAPLEPITALPGYGLVAVTFYSYLICDNDPYNEVSIAVIIRQPGKGSYSTTQLFSSIWNRTFYGYVLALPVDTEIARVRGVYGYQLPKWLANINLEMDENNIKADITTTDGKLDLALDVPLPALKTIPSQSSIVNNNAINKIDEKWYQVTVQTNPLLGAQRVFPRDVNVYRGRGPLSELLNELGAWTVLRMDVLKDAQMVLHMPTPLKAFDNNKL
ncbi:Acetoacetate decarboxylase [Penicillium cataractarum]|uniref:Acetoacetate decarboxylase n=1 Tax=Penicillium cataractarum TaxID=2100454 RepID=A0A9X0B5U6_9EURO|nr:Acetoacetate decarboxylase [Penicillium cataractarum]KAJ5389210.1 Acetoacetate decarboxylase [Penicillium cataractarum]